MCRHPSGQGGSASAPNGHSLGGPADNRPKTVTVLNRMPRDCTEPAARRAAMQDGQSLSGQVSPTTQEMNTNNKQRKGKQGIPRNQKKKRNARKTKNAPNTGDLASRIRQLELRDRISDEEMECIRNYSAALINPFNLITLPCNPHADPGMAVRVRQWTRGTIKVGSGLSAFIVYNSRALPGTLSMFGSTDSSLYTSVNLDTSAGGVTGITPISNVGSFTDGKIKCVGVGIKLWYSGKPLECTGMIYQLRNYDNHHMLAGLTTAANIQANVYNKCMPARVGRTYYTNFIPYDFGVDNQYSDGVTSTSVNPYWNLGFFIDGGVQHTTYHYEIVAYHEYVSSTSANMGGAVPSPVYKEAATKIVNSVMDADRESQANGFDYQTVTSAGAYAFEKALGPMLGATSWQALRMLRGARDVRRDTPLAV